MGLMMHKGVAYGSSNFNTYYGTTDPISTSGNNGDLYFKYDNTNNKIVAIYCKINNIWMDYVATIISTLPSQNETNGLQEEVEVVTS